MVLLIGKDCILMDSFWEGIKKNIKMSQQILFKKKNVVTSFIEN